MTQDELSRKIITIKGLELKEWKKNGNEYSKFELYAGKKYQKNTKYWFWTKTKDGKLRKAMKQLKEMGFPINKKVGAIFNAKPKSFTNKAGKKIEFTDREIVSFKSLDNTVDKIREQKAQEEEEIEEEKEREKEIEANV